ncbi:MAG: extracellular solute-binding protein [Lachnospiraceae bacterium]|jgi:arabinogalactan oligomer/maltooligosaccharide transport system substrate-binding protein|uniref:extracellular solute-binding protein n=1 Tax=Bacillota TaxID=1239 RepID=UPI001DCE7F93|nr:extracellular solute-binding protein [Mediterraneibacter gnavus]MBS5131105.1 extracellular solute-binding protein [Lachnospiraceae bacterium]MCZ0634842.1 extracellular solute-binding protein [Mediterraneibacter gnavus]
MKKKIAMLLSATLIVGIFSGCANKSTNADKSNSEDSSDQKQISIWHDGDEAIMQVIEDQVNGKLSKDNITVHFEKKTGLTDQIKLYGSDEKNGPDMYMYAHDSLGTFVEMGVLAPITDVVEKSAYSDMLPMTLKAGQYKGEQYLLPVYYETLLFMYNKALWEGEIPSTTEELYEYMTTHTDSAAGTYALVNQHSTAYNVAPIINGFGGYIIDEEAMPGLNNEKTQEAIEYNKKFAELEADGDYNTITTLFNEGKAAAIVGGPWLVSGIKDAGIDLGIKSLAEFTLPNGNTLVPYSGVQGIGVMKHAADTKKEMLGKVLTALADPQIGTALAEQSSCAPANQKSYEVEAVSNNEMITAMKKTAEVAIPMPNIPEMSVMWGPAEALLAAVNKSGEDVKAVSEQYQKEAETAIADMQ